MSKSGHLTPYEENKIFTEELINIKNRLDKMNLIKPNSNIFMVHPGNE